jgi:hypothetical protein
MADRLAAHPPAPLSTADSAMLTGDRATVRPLPRHLAFGSGYPYADHDERAPIDCDFAGAPVPSLAVGGLSSVWGGAMLPIAETDLASWPIGAAAAHSPSKPLGVSAALFVTGLHGGKDGQTHPRLMCAQPFERLGGQLAGARPGGVGAGDGVLDARRPAPKCPNQRKGHRAPHRQTCPATCPRPMRPGCGRSLR